LALAGTSQAQTTPKKAAKEQVKFNEAEALREAYLLLAAANHDYDGHRAKAMKQIQEAVGILDRSVMKKGTEAQKEATVIEDTKELRAKVIAKHVPKVHEGQAQSDAQLRAAADLLLKVESALVAGKQKKVLSHVEHAGREIVAALKVR
jgi:hypothetical protein